MAEKIGEAYIDITGRTKKYEQALKRTKTETQKVMQSAKSTSGGFSKGFSMATLKIAALVIALQRAYQVLEKLGDMAAQAEKSFAVLAAVFQVTGEAAGFSADEINRYIEGISFATAASADELRKAAAILGTFVDIGKTNFKGALNTVGQMGVIFGGIEQSAKQIGKVLADPKANLSALARNGVTFSESMKKTVKYLQEQNDLATAQAIILREIQKQGVEGVLEEQAESVAGKLEIYANEFNKIAETFGQTWNELKLEFLDKYGEQLKELIFKIGGFLQKAPVIFKDVITFLKVLRSIQFTILNVLTGGLLSRLSKIGETLAAAAQSEYEADKQQALTEKTATDKLAAKDAQIVDLIALVMGIKTEKSGIGKTNVGFSRGTSALSIIAMAQAQSIKSEQAQLTKVLKESKLTAEEQLVIDKLRLLSSRDLNQTLKDLIASRDIKQSTTTKDVILVGGANGKFNLALE